MNSDLGRDRGLNTAGFCTVIANGEYGAVGQPQLPGNLIEAASSHLELVFDLQVSGARILQSVIPFRTPPDDYGRCRAQGKKKSCN